MPTPTLAVNVAPEPTLVLAPVLVTEPCPDKQRLRAELSATMDDIIALVVRQLDAVRFGTQPAVEEFLERKIADARRRKDMLIDLYKLHVSRHSC